MQCIRAVLHTKSLNTSDCQLTFAGSIGHHGGRVVALAARKTVIRYDTLEAVSRARSTVAIVDLVCLLALPTDHLVFLLRIGAGATIERTR